MPEMSDANPRLVEFDSVKANSASLLLNNFAHSLQRADHQLGDALQQFADEFGQRRVDASNTDDDDTIELCLPAETYRTIAAVLRMNALNRNVDALETDLTGMSEVMADDARELARLFDEAALEADRKR